MQATLAVSVKEIGKGSDRILRFVSSDESEDRDGDIIKMSGWELDNYKKNPVLLWAHSYSMPPIAKAVNIYKDPRLNQLVIDAKFPTISELSTDGEHVSDHAKFADTVYNMYKNSYLSTTSVGFRALEHKRRDDAEAMKKPEWERGAIIFRQELYEVSFVPVPANPNALIQARSIVDSKFCKAFGINDEIIKTGRRLSASTMESIDEIRKCFDEIKGYHKSAKEVHDRLDEIMAKLVDDGTEEEEPPKEAPIPEKKRLIDNDFIAMFEKQMRGE